MFDLCRGRAGGLAQGKNAIVKSDPTGVLKESDPDDFAAVLAGLARLRNREYQKPPLSKPVGDELFELRHVGKLNTRVLYFFMKGRRIILVHGIRKKTRALSARDRRIALERKRDWFSRNPG